MDFFQSQDEARRRTVLLVALYGLAILVITMITYVVIAALSIPFAALHHWARDWYDLSNSYTPPPLPGIWSPALLARIMAAMVLTMVGATIVRSVRMARPGPFVAEMLGGRAVSPASASTRELRLLHVVEEMAIASGTPVPEVYVLDVEPGINTFAAGLAARDAVVVATLGALDMLTRDELQAAVAHEFSHILNGDMRMKTRVLSVLYGITFVERLCSWPFRAFSGSIARGEAAAGAAMILTVLTAPVFLPFLLVSWTGTSLARMIKGAVAREREYLADAAAVQLTRNPAALAGALKKIGGAVVGSRILSAGAGEANHMFLADAMGRQLISAELLASHPPLAERVRRLDPSFSGEFPFVPTNCAEGADAWPAAPQSAADAVDGPSGSGGIMDDIGVPRPEHLAYAAALLAAIPPPLLQAVRGETGAQAIVLALLLDASDTVRNAQLDYLQRHAGDAVMAALGELEPQMAGLPPETRLPLAELAVSALRHTDAETYRSFRDAVETLATTDREVDLFEYVLYRMILRRLAPSFEPAASPPPARHALAPLLPHCGELLSCLVAIARPDQAGRETAFAAAAAKLAPAGTLRLRNPGRCPVAALDRALAPLAEAAPRIKKRVLDACVTAAAADGTATADEAMLLQAVADALDCPMPPILPGQDI